MRPIRAAVCRDYAEERWPSMDRVARELVDHLRRGHASRIDATSICAPFVRRAARLSAGPAAASADRFVNRWWEYPRHVRPLGDAYDVFHVVDHSYAHLVHALPASRTVVTCHDLDAFRSLLRPRDEPRSAAFRAMSRRILTGLGRAARVSCDTHAVAAELVAVGLVDPSRIVVAPIGVSAAFTADGGAAPMADVPAGTRWLLHVGSTIPRKRIDLLLAVFAELRRGDPRLRLARVGGAMTPEQRALANTLGVADAISEWPSVDELRLASIYRASDVVLLPSDREGFGLPIVEAMASGTPVVASDLPVLREVGGDAAVYAAAGDPAEWVRAVVSVLDAVQTDASAWAARRQAGLLRARRFSWTQFASSIAGVYEEIACGGAALARNTA